MYRGWPFTSWGLSINIPSTIQKRLLKFLLKKALGQFLAEEPDIDNLEVQLGNGTVQLKELRLNVEVLLLLIIQLSAFHLKHLIRLRVSFDITFSHSFNIFFLMLEGIK